MIEHRRFVVGLCLAPLWMAAAACSEPPPCTCQAVPHEGGADADPGGDPDGGTSGDGGTDAAMPDASVGTMTVRPREIAGVLSNPGMGLADFFGNAPETDYPRTTVAYHRWSWAELEPSPGDYNFALVDATIASTRAKGQTLAFRIMPHWEESTPQWLLDMGVASVAVDDGVFPDHNDPRFLARHEQLVRAFGARYAGSPDIDHVDIGSVGCWGEWNVACCTGEVDTCKGYFPTETNWQRIIDWYIEAFEGTPLVSLLELDETVGFAMTIYAVERGAGWRGDCFGDYGIWGAGWNHMDDVYSMAAAHPVLGEAWKHAPVQFEVCATMQTWQDRGFDVERIFRKGLEWHTSVLNAKTAPIPAGWRPHVDAFLERVGYRFVLRELTHPERVAPGETMALRARWENVGVAPIYHRWPLAYRLRDVSSDEVVAQWQSTAELRNWLPGEHVQEDAFPIPAEVPPGDYALEVAILTVDGARAHVHLAIEGGRPDLWYPLSTVRVEP